MSQEVNIDLGYIVHRIKNVLKRSHSNPVKHDVRPYPDSSNPARIAFACPHCGDSAKQASKKRANFYISTAMVKCYNCGYYSSITGFFDMFGEAVSPDERLKLYDYIDTHARFSKSGGDMDVTSLDRLIPIDEFIEYFNTREQSWLCDVRKVSPGSSAYMYLKGRCLPSTDGFLEGTYRVFKDGVLKFKTRVIVSLNTGGGKLLGIQLRNLQDGEKRFYKIIEFSEVYNYMHPDAPLDGAEAIAYNKLSHFYNILNVDFDEPVTVFEGYIDSKFFPNSIGLVGLGNTDDLLRFLLESDDNLDLRFFYDNDAPGIRKATEMIDKGYKVFLWNLLFKKLRERHAGGIGDMLDGIKDLNNVAVKAGRSDVSEKLKLDRYFSSDSFDKVYLDKVVWDKANMVWVIKK